ncbi:MAG TPA: putative glycoside hydrolase [Candidatus Angelobacter sp.]|nr:putative glycoside hydrolase [Candidatus Angelobacter sp.]
MPPKKVRVISTVLLSLLALLVTTLLLGRRALTFAPTHASAAQNPAATVAGTPAAAIPQLPPGTIAYSAKATTTATFLARQYLTESSYMTIPEFEEEIRKANSGKAIFQRGETAVIPGMEPQPVVEKSRTFPKDGEVRAIYLTGTTAGSAKGIELIRRWHQAGGNAVVFDIKDSDGTVNVPFSHPLSRKRKSYPISNLPKFVRFLHSLDMHVIARQALFRDDNIAKNHGALAVQSRSLHAPWRENGKLVWADSSNKEVQDYNLALAKYVAESGVDEVQFDYVRFPAEGNQGDAQFAFQRDPKVDRADVIAKFLDRAYTELHAAGVLVSLDVFGVMAWQRQVDLRHTGQDVVRMAQHCDVLSPMIYPSHFFGMDNYKTPGDAPEHFISVSMDRYVKVTAGTGVTLRPWLQAFRWRTRTYSPQYILTQVSTSKRHGGDGFLFWNAGNDYSKPFAAMPVMMANPKLYLYTPPAQAQTVAATPDQNKNKQNDQPSAPGQHP